MHPHVPPYNLDADETERLTRPDEVIINLQGECLRWHAYVGPRDPPPVGMRKPCDGMSVASRMNMLRMVHGIDWNLAGRSHFLTLTYPDPYYGISGVDMTAHRSAFQDIIELHYRHHICGIWRTEWEVRKTGRWVGKYMPHMHVIIFRENSIRNWEIVDMWARSISWKRYVDTKVKDMYTKKYVARYVAKYCAKERAVLGITANPGKLPRGRAWGRFRPKLFPSSKTKEIVLQDSIFVENLRVSFAPTLRPEIDFGQKGFTLFGAQAITCWKQIFERGLADGELDE